MSSQLRRNLTSVRDEIARAAEQGGRDPASVELVAVTKYADWDWVRALYDLGQRAFGESRPQQLAERAPQLPDDVVWHMIGTLQANKVRTTVQHAGVIHSIDSQKLLARTNRIAGEEEVHPSIFLQVNVSGENAKHGWSPESLESQQQEIMAALSESRHVSIAGLMAMAPRVAVPADARPFFAQLRNLRDTAFPDLTSLSMGMSGDFSEAILEGATHVRVGSRLFAGL